MPKKRKDLKVITKTRKTPCWTCDGAGYIVNDKIIKSLDELM